MPKYFYLVIRWDLNVFIVYHIEALQGTSKENKNIATKKLLKNILQAETQENKRTLKKHFCVCLKKV